MVTKNLHGIARQLEKSGRLPAKRNAGRPPQSLVTWFSPATFGWLGLLAGLSAGLADWLIGSFLVTPAPDRRAAALLYSLAHLLLAAVPAALALWALAGWGRRSFRLDPQRTPDRVRRLVWIPASLVFGALAWRLFEGDRISRVAYVTWIRVGVIAAGVVAIGLLARALVRHVFRETGGASRGRAACAAALFGAMALALHYADATVYTGGYPAAHTLLALAVAALHVLFWLELFALLEEHVPRGRGPLLVALAAVVAGCLLAGVRLRGSPSVHVLRPRLSQAGYPLARKVVPLVERLVFRHLAPLATVDVEDATGLLELAFAAKTPEETLARLLPPGRERWNVVFIAADTVRRDAVGFMAGGGEGSPTPNLDELARRARVFEHAYTPYPTSSYAYSSLLTGYYPRQTPARQAADRRVQCPPDASLPQVLREHGWTTWAVTAFNEAGVVEGGPFHHTREGFDVFNPRQTDGELVAPQVTERALALLDRRDPDEPFFLWVHYMDPHESYRPHAEFDYGPGPHALYRGEVSYMDHHMKPLLDRLSEPELRDSTLVCFFADHGESFGEHNTTFHNSNLHDEQTKVPLAVAVPGLEPGREEALANLVDLTPTVLGLLGIEDPFPRMGRDLSGLLAGAIDRRSWIDFSYSERYPRDPLPGREMQRCLVYDGLKLIRFADDPGIEVYDLERDPAEERNVIDPANERQRRALGFMSALDERIDGFFGRKAPSGLAVLHAHVDGVIEMLADGDAANDPVALNELGRTLMGYDRHYSPETAERLGKERMARIRELLIASAANQQSPLSIRMTAVYLINNLPDPALAPIMKESLTSPLPNVRASGALWLAREGDDAGRDILLESLTEQKLEWNMAAAVGLARLDEPAAIPWLLPLLSRVHSAHVVDALEGLDRLRYADLDLELRERLAAHDVGLGLPRPELEVARIAARRPGDDATLLLLRLSFSREPAVQEVAKGELERRLPRARRERARAMSEQRQLGDGAARDGSYELAARYYQETLERQRELDLRDDLTRIAAARALMVLGRHDPAAELLAPLMTDPLTRAWIRSYARAVLRAARAGAPILVRPDQAHVEAKLDTSLETPPLPSSFFARWVELVNTGDTPLTGGHWHHGLRLVWMFRDVETGEIHTRGTDRAVLQSFLPRAGLAPGERTRVVAIGVTPNIGGRYQPLLTLHIRPWASPEHRVLATLDEIKVGLR